MKRLLFLLAVAGLALPAAALAKGPSEATITGPGLAHGRSRSAEPSRMALRS